MRNFQLAMKLFVKDVFLSLSFLAFFIYINVKEIKVLMLLDDYGASDATGSLFISLTLSLFFFVFFMFLSYEYFYKLRASNLEECIKATNTGLQTLYGNQLLVMLILSALVTLTVLIYNLICYFYLEINHTEYLIHIIKNIFVNICMVSILGILIGMYAALVFKRLKAYLLLILFALLTSSIFESICFTLYNTEGIDIYPIFEFFNLYSPSLNWATNFNFGYSVLPYRKELVMLWLFALSTLIFLKLSKNQKAIFKTCAGFCAVICLVNLILYVQPSSKVIMSCKPSECLCNDILYYKTTGQKDEPADFTITNYNLDITIANQLSVEAKLSIDKGNLPRYTFTLYRGYTVKRITDQDGNALSFTQDSDYIAVTNNGTDLSEIVLCYSGFSPEFYSNSEGTCLPGYFPFYPHSGYIPLYNVQSQGFYPVLLPDPVDFTVQIKSAKTVYCNLAENEDGSFIGVSDGVTIMTGFLDTMTVQGVQIIYPYLCYSVPEYLESYIKSRLENKTDDQVINKIFIMPNLNQSTAERTVFYSDYTTIL